MSRFPRVLWTAVVVSPLAVAVVVLLWRPWVPVLDMVMTEFRVRDVGGRHTPLVGLPGRIGDFPDQGSHPGPWSFYLVAPWYRLAGATAWGMQLASVVINAACCAALVSMGHRRFGGRGALAFALVAAIAVRGYGLDVLTHPWNPYFPVLIWMVALVAAWLVLLGDHGFAVVVIVTATIAAQTHVPYLVSALAVSALVIAVLAWRIATATGPTGSNVAGDTGGVAEDRSTRPTRPLIIALAVGAVLWVPPMVQELRHRPGNLSQLFDHFTSEQSEPSIGMFAATKLFTQHFDLVAITLDLIRRDDALVHRAGQAGDASLVGALVVGVWVGAAVWAWRRRHAPLLALHAVTGVAAVAGVVAMSRIFGRVWFYLTLWMSGTVLLVALALAWTALVIALDWSRPPSVRHLYAATAALIVGVTALSLLAAARHDAPERNLADDVSEIVGDVVAALTDGVGAAPGRNGSYVMFWQEAVVPGAQGYALMNELERRGFDVGVHSTWRVPATPHRVQPHGQYDAEVHLVSGAWIDGWAREGYVQIVDHDGRSPGERARYDELATRVELRLVELDRADLVDVVRRNIFGLSLDPGLPDDVVADLEEMLQLGERVVVYIAPPNSTL